MPSLPCREHGDAEEIDRVQIGASGVRDVGGCGLLGQLAAT
jgi:hypothetical protein